MIRIIIGMILGGFIGVFSMCFCNVAAQADKNGY
ncbi:MAG: DUF3789 domain-containing protein [Lachnospiraceae bacterium]|nr:DUF3789 domain-containing protein [Lachnospiraceae bacterium]